MIIYLAGGVQSLTSDMKLFLAESGGLWEAYFDEKDFSHVYILQSYYYADDFTEKYIIPNASDFMLDSGAFTFMQDAKTRVNWDKYIEKYAEFINRNRIKKYFELDIDSVVGYNKVKELRARLEDLTGRASIPVWHKSRGLNEYFELCDKYSYIAIGGIVSKEIVLKDYKYFPFFISEAHKRGAKVHGLGFTRLDKLSKYHFDSVDSTAWTTGNRFGYIYKFNGKTVKKIDSPEGFRLKDSRQAALNNFVEWVKYQKYAERCL